VDQVRFFVVGGLFHERPPEDVLAVLAVLLAFGIEALFFGGFGDDGGNLAWSVES